jgi:hypothetical protein
MWCCCLVFFVAVASVAAAADTDTTATAKLANVTVPWVIAVEEMLSSISLGPLKKEFTPEYVARRTRVAAIASKTARLRARVATSIIESTDTRAVTCVANEIDEVVNAVIEELKALGFTDAYHLKSAPPECVGTAAVLVKVPPPAANKEQKEL